MKKYIDLGGSLVIALTFILYIAAFLQPGLRTIYCWKPGCSWFQ